MIDHAMAAPLKHKYFTPGVWFLTALFGSALLIALVRFIFGLGLVTNLNNGYPWGIWIAIDVASGVALAAGGFTSAFLIHIIHKEKFEALSRPALLTAMLGYTFVVIGLLVDLGRYYNVWHPLLPVMWQGNSALFEVGMCVMTYITVLYIEFIPIVAEEYRNRVNLPILKFLNRPMGRLLAFLDSKMGKFMFIFVILGVVLSFMHQSSLGALMVLVKTKMHPLWWSPVLALEFLLSAIAVGFPMIIVESLAASRSFKMKPEMSILTPFARYVPILLGLYLATRFADLTIREVWHYVDGSLESRFFVAEIFFGGLLPFFMLLSEKIRRSPKWLFIAALLVVLGVVFNRINVYLVAFKPLYVSARYFPTIWEILVTLGFVAGLILVYRFIVIHLPVIHARRDAS
ncbi:MAG TPA: Ni/Fe-hydrogenase cytochrome b subunit [Candidatus Marinimicrobia bacterium]|nr:MAG: polysulfide reductase [Candidatus Marinimicrobia bacterium CG1_02_48_14]HCW75634.1 Ni/Fe-hydrogenase cytochrome b subunit [Candidatus Neomarinimicrobiota bacterium]